jgi:small multidrug resistance pump
MHWIFLVIAIVLEVIATTFLKVSHGLTRFLPFIFAGICGAASFLIYALALKKIDISVAYPIWSGLGTVLVAVIGLWIFKEHISPARWLFLAMIVFGIAGLYMTHA